jgi:peptide/nickel transport system permease protein
MSRLIYGARASLEVAVGSVAIALILGLVVGVQAAYRGGWFDTAVGILTDSILAFPGLVLLLVLAAFLKPGTGTLVIGLSTLAFPNFTRLARANGLRYKSAEFVEAARVLGARTSTVLLREIIPNVIGVLAAYAGVVTAALVIAEASLSYLGLGIQPPTPSWGNMINDGQQVLATDPYLVLVPSVVLFLTVFSLTTVGEWFRARSDDSGRI